MPTLVSALSKKSSVSTAAKAVPDKSLSPLFRSFSVHCLLTSAPPFPSLTLTALHTYSYCLAFNQVRRGLHSARQCRQLVGRRIMPAPPRWP